VTNEWGCTDTGSILVTVQPCCELAIPNAFMPNSAKSGPDAIFRPVTERNFNVHIFRVVNRWGQTVFETNNLSNGWDGTLNGVPQDVGVYFYYLKYDCEGKTIEKSGDVTLIR
jgi:gliding motility-associated-like protein